MDSNVANFRLEGISNTIRKYFPSRQVLLLVMDRGLRFRITDLRVNDVRFYGPFVVEILDRLRRLLNVPYTRRIVDTRGAWTVAITGLEDARRRTRNLNVVLLLRLF